MALIYDYMLKTRKSVYISDILVQAVHILGTPEELKNFSKNR